jgi:hypothetical protein
MKYSESFINALTIAIIVLIAYFFISAVILMFLYGISPTFYEWMEHEDGLTWWILQYIIVFFIIFFASFINGLLNPGIGKKESTYFEKKTNYEYKSAYVEDPEVIIGYDGDGYDNRDWRDIPDDSPKSVRKRIPTDVKRAVWERDRGRCVICKSQKNLEFDHVIPFAKGGSNSEKNIQVLCQECNRKKSDKIL